MKSSTKKFFFTISTCLNLATLTLICLAGSPAMTAAKDDVSQGIWRLYAPILAEYSKYCTSEEGNLQSCDAVKFSLKKKILSADLKKLLLMDAECAKRNGLCNLYFDFLINGQDTCGKPLKIISIKHLNNSYVMKVSNGCTATNDYKPEYDFMLLPEHGQWVIDDIHYYNEGTFTLKKMLKQPLPKN
jgi:hypothetical protein